MPMNESPTPSRFEYTIGMNQNATLVLVLSLAVMVIAVAITMVVIADSSPELWFIPFVLLVSGGIVARVISQTFVTYTIDEEGFLKHGRGGVKERVLTWRDISALKPRRSGVEGVELVDNKGAVPVKMYGQLRGYEHFVQLLPRMRPDLWDFQTTRTFQKTGLFFGMGLLTLFFLLFGVFAVTIGEVAASFFFFGLGAVMVWLLWRTSYRLEVQPDAITVKALQGTARLTPADVRALTLQRTQYRNTISYNPTLELHNGKKVNLGGFHSMTVDVYGTLMRWWERGR
jgi:hypothetical protein